MSKTVLLAFALLVTLAAPAQWVQKADALRPRSEVTSVVYNNKLYTFLGFSNADLQTNGSSEVYDPATDTWQLLAAIPEGKSMTHQGVVLVDNTVWFIGGRVGQNPGPLTSETWIYNLSTDAWSPGPELTDPATGTHLRWGGGGAALIGRTLHVFGGFVDNACSNDQDQYHLTLNVDGWLTSRVAQWKNDRKPLPMKRCHVACVVLAGKIYALGGQSGHDCGEEDLDVAHVYNPATDTWRQLPDLPAPRSHAEGAAFAVDGKIYIVAGQQRYSKNTNKVTVFDPAANYGYGRWADVPGLNLPFAYEGVSAKVIGDAFIYTHGGKGASQNTQTGTYTRTIARKPVRKLGFLSRCITLSAPAGGNATGKNLLFTIDGTAAYQVTSSAPWLSVTRNANGKASSNGADVEVRVDAAGLAAGTYQGTLTATGADDGNAYTPASFCVNLTVTSNTVPTPTVRLNAGGSAYRTVAGTSFDADMYFTGGRTARSVNGEVTGTNDDELYWSGRVGEEFSYAIPTGNGAFSVTLYFNESYWGHLADGGAGSRQFHVDAEGSRRLTDYDIYARAGGAMRAIAETFPVTVTDDTLTVRFTKGSADVPRVAALVVEPAGAPNRYQAEAASVVGAEVSTLHPGFTGTGFVDYLNPVGDYVEWTFDQADSGNVTLNFRYANGGTEARSLLLSVDGTTVQEQLSFPVTADWSRWSVVKVPVTLAAGSRKVRLSANGTSGPNLDYLEVSVLTATRPAPNLTLARLAGPEGILSPNPATNRAQLTLTAHEALHVQVISPVGKVVREFRFPPSPAGTYDLSLAGLPRGMYSVQVQGTA
ncbi:MAG: carbohydrate-binding protein, partial [Cytophagales bacterium]|nr:carbohydrate-binding protein [Cytophagales bacterium]